MNNRISWPNVVVWACFLAFIGLLGKWTWAHQRDIDRLESRLDALERRAAVTVQRVDIHVERAADAPVVADGLLRHTLPGFARVKRLATAKDLQP